MPQNSLKLHTPFLKGRVPQQLKKGGCLKRLSHLPHPISTTAHRTSSLYVSTCITRRARTFLQDIMTFKSACVLLTDLYLFPFSAILDSSETFKLFQKYNWLFKLNFASKHKNGINDFCSRTTFLSISIQGVKMTPSGIRDKYQKNNF